MPTLSFVDVVFPSIYVIFSTSSSRYVSLADETHLGILMKEIRGQLNRGGPVSIPVWYPFFVQEERKRLAARAEKVRVEKLSEKKQGVVVVANFPSKGILVTAGSSSRTGPFPSAGGGGAPAKNPAALGTLSIGGPNVPHRDEHHDVDLHHDRDRSGPSGPLLQQLTTKPATPPNTPSKKELVRRKNLERACYAVTK